LKGAAEAADEARKMARMAPQVGNQTSEGLEYEPVVAHSLHSTRFSGSAYRYASCL